MRQRYIVYHDGRAVGWVHAENPMEAIQRVAMMTGKPAEARAAVQFE
jgi:Flp pilus assembly CpaF family ATPase